MPKRVLVTGGRKYPNKEKVHSALNKIHGTLGISHLIQGGAGGADMLARLWAEEHPEVKVISEEPGQRMIDKHKPDIGLVFPGGSETEDVRRRLLRAQILIMEFHE